MTIRYDVARFMKRHKLTNANQLALFAKIPPPLAYRVLSGVPLDSIKVSSLESLARAFEVKPWSLLRYEPD